MDPSGANPWSRALRVIRSPEIRLAAPLVTLGVLLAVDLLGGRGIRIGGLMVAVPALSAVSLGPVAVLLLAVLTLGGVLLTSWENGTLDTENFPVILATVVLVGGASVVAARRRGRRERELAQARKVAEATQRALLRPLPKRLGRVTLSSMYLAAEEEAAIGGDLYAAAPTGRCGARVLVGDVQGKGMAAVEVVGLLLSAFRRAARARAPLSELMAHLDSGLRADLQAYPQLVAASGTPVSPYPAVQPGSGGAGGGAGAGVSGDGPAGTGPGPGDGFGDCDGSGSLDGEAEDAFDERFVTAVAVDVSDDGRTVHVANSGHPPPLLIHGGAVEQLFPSAPELPLGLGDLSRQEQRVDSYDLAVGDILLLYTDGVIEARNHDGVFYPLADRLARWAADTPEALLTDIRADLMHHTDSRLADDLAMVAVQRVA